MKKELTEKQNQIFQYIKEQVSKNGYVPTVREICEAVHLKSTSSVHTYLTILEDKGYIRRDPTKPRAIEILDDCFGLPPKNTVQVPLIGSVAAGQPILAEENIENYFPIPADILPHENVFLLKVKGDSMINAGIFEGDQIIVAQQETAKNGDIVVALLEDSATVKRFFREEDHIRLQPENDTMKPFIVTDVQILGKVVGLIRFL